MQNNLGLDQYDLLKLLQTKNYTDIKIILLKIFTSNQVIEMYINSLQIDIFDHFCHKQPQANSNIPTILICRLIKTNSLEMIEYIITQKKFYNFTVNNQIVINYILKIKDETLAIDCIKLLLQPGSKILITPAHIDSILKLNYLKLFENIVYYLQDFINLPAYKVVLHKYGVPAQIK